MKAHNVISEFKGQETSDVKTILKEKSFPIAIYADHWRGDYNLAMSMRNANAFGAREFFYMGQKKFDPRHACGTQFYTDITYLDNIEQLSSLKTKYPIFIGIENNVPNCVSLHDFIWPEEPCLLLFGQEGYGLNPELIPLCDHLVFIPQFGSVPSLNVGTTSGIVLYDYTSKRYKNREY